MKDTIKSIKLTELYPYQDTPFKPHDLDEIAESIREYGVITPLIARVRSDGGYEVIAGHRRMLGAEKSGITEIPVIIRSMDDDAAVIALVDSNLHRESILPSERAFAYKMKLEAIKHQGRTCDRVEHKSRDVVADSVGVSGSQVQRYIRLTKLIKPLLDLADNGRIALSPAVELSYLPREEQENIAATVETEDRTPSYSQTVRMRKLSEVGSLDMNTIFKIMTEEKPNQREVLKLQADKVKGFFPKSYTPQQMEQTILKLLGDWQRQRERQRQRDDAR
jgi:ParB family chromosome partitioning protein